MATREKPSNNEYYHIYNRGVDKRDIFIEKIDQIRFIKSMVGFNTIKPVGSLYHADRLKNDVFTKHTNSKQLVEIVAYCLNPNHFHLILRQLEDGGISEFMKRLSGGYTYYFNDKYQRSGSLFQGTYKYKHIDTTEYLNHLSVYVNLNYKVHKLSKSSDQVFYSSSWGEYIGSNLKYQFCSTEIILEQFRLVKDYVKFSDEALAIILENKDLKKETEFDTIRKGFSKNTS